MSFLKLKEFGSMTSTTSVGVGPFTAHSLTASYYSILILEIGKQQVVMATKKIAEITLI
jgi:hypothetical protein